MRLSDTLQAGLSASAMQELTDTPIGKRNRFIAGEISKKIENFCTVSQGRRRVSAHCEVRRCVSD